MRLEYTCSGCKKQNKYTPVTATRGELQMKVGDEVDVNCDYCGKLDKKHINRIDAVVDSRKMLVAFVISAVVTCVLFMYFGLIGTITFGIPFLMWVQENKSISSFNSYKIRRR
ncbi:hypothetical protein M0D21_16600 [Aquimarina sp. D1M17]|uniref:hypothetical protein n=1 Tax=Aquimarina acroporae TaxID=2937283 RepID=UPI0020C060F1|nr:hypothetical protein [Aquimarina acroporae]MCK8523201.1 hypothetical protein [Aquimarina acroporae]